MSVKNMESDDELRQRDLRRQREREEEKKRHDELVAEELKKRQEEEQMRIQEQKRIERQRQEWERLGSDVIQPMAPLPPPLKDVNPNSITITSHSVPTPAPEAWYLDSNTSKPALSTISLKPGRRPNTPPVTLKELSELGVVFFTTSLSDLTVVKQLLRHRNYKHVDEVRVSQTAKDDVFLERWFQEHYLEDEEMRLVTDGSCYIDIRSKQDKWIRVHLMTGHMIVLPPGMYHRATLDEDDYTALFRGFRDAPRFFPIYRSDSAAETRKVRLDYLIKLKKGNVASAMGFL